MVEAKDMKENELVAFEEKYLQAFKDFAHLEQHKKSVEEQSKRVRDQIERAMDEYGITKIENDYVSIVRIDATPGKKTIDLKALEKEEPDEYASLLEDYPKITGQKKAYIQIRVKGGTDNGES